MEFDQLRTFLAVVEHGNFGRAADALHMAQSTASFHIKALETHLGSRLLDRGGGVVRLTSSGQTLKAYAGRILSLRSEAEARITAVTDGEAGELTIAASTVPGEYLLPAALVAFCAANPAVGININVSDSRRATAMALAGDVDLAIVGAEPTDRRLESRPVAHDEIVLVGPKGDPFGVGDRLAPDGLAAVPLIRREDGSGTRDAVAAIVARGTPQPGVEGAARIRVGSTEAARRCVRQGLGVGFLSRIAVADDLAAGLVRVIEMEGLPIRRTFYGVWRTGATLAAAGAKLLDVVAEQNGR
jgi:DNA-binding transcriptional LysR family regulator